VNRTGRHIKGWPIASDKQMMTPECKNPAARACVRFPWRWILCLLAVAAPIAPAYLYLFRDEPLHDDSDLLLEEKPVPPEDNGWDTLKAGTEKVYWPELPSLDGIRNGESPYERAEAMSDGISWDAELAEDLPRRNEAALKLFDESRRFRAFVRTDGDDYDGSIHFSELRALVNSVFIRAFLAEQHGRVEEAFEDAMNAVRLGRKLRRSGVSLFNGATVLEMGGLKVLRSFLRLLLADGHRLIPSERTSRTPEVPA